MGARLNHTPVRTKVGILVRRDSEGQARPVRVVQGVRRNPSFARSFALWAVGLAYVSLPLIVRPLQAAKRKRSQQVLTSFPAGAYDAFPANILQRFLERRRRARDGRR